MKHARSDYDRIQDPDNLIPEDEPVFLIRAQDVLSAGMLETYADRAEAVGCDPLMVGMVREHAEKMRKWGTKKTPDV